MMSTPTNFNQPNYGNNQGNSQKRVTTCMGVTITLLLGVLVVVGVMKISPFKSNNNEKTELLNSRNSYETVKDEIRNEIGRLLSVRDINTILIADYLNLDNRQDKFGRYLAEDFSALFTRGYNSFRVIERSRLNLLLEEQDLKEAGLLDQQKVSELGRIIGVQSVITGKYQIVGNYLKLWIKVIDIEKSQLLITKEVKILIEGELKDALNL